MRSHLTPEQRFWKYVNKDGPVPSHVPHLGNCWIWTAGKNWQGYGKFCIRHGKSTQAHRFSICSALGISLEKGQLSCHKYDNPSCVRPDHLFVGTHKDNAEDRGKKGRTALAKGRKIHPDRIKSRGEQNAMAKLTEQAVLSIRADFSSGYAQKDLVEKYGVGFPQIHRIVRRHLWRHI